MSERGLTWEPDILASLAEGLFIFDRAGRLARLNPSGERIAGTSERLLLGLPAPEVFPHNPEVPEIVAAALSEGRTVGLVQVRLLNLEQEVLYLSFSVSPLEDGEGLVQGAVLLARDETLLRQLQRSFARADQLANLGTLAVGFAHEIKNPLGGIKGATQLLRMELPPGSPLAEHCDVILREVERVDGLLESLMDAAPREQPKVEALNVHEVLNEVLSLISRWTGREPIPVRRLFDPSLPLVRGDRRGLIQVFLNLLKNAVEATPPGAPVVVRTYLSTGALLRPGPLAGAGALEAAIEDEGPGFPPNLEGSLSPFFTTKPKGVGLGLVISEQIVARHGGRLILENREDEAGQVRGARARVVLPIGEEAGA